MQHTTYYIQRVRQASRGTALPMQRIRAPRSCALGARAPPLSAHRGTRLRVAVAALVASPAAADAIQRRDSSGETAPPCECANPMCLRGLAALCMARAPQRFALSGARGAGGAVSNHMHVLIQTKKTSASLLPFRKSRAMGAGGAVSCGASRQVVALASRPTPAPPVVDQPPSPVLCTPPESVT